MTLVLLLKAHEARTKDHRRTEMWLYLPEGKPSAPGLCATDDFGRDARNLFAICAMDVADIHRDVDNRAVFLPSWDLGL